MSEEVENEQCPEGAALGIGIPEDPLEVVIRLRTPEAGRTAATDREHRLVRAGAGLLVWMDAEEAAEYLHYPKATFNALAARGEIPRYKRGAGYRYHRDELDEWLRRG